MPKNTLFDQDVIVTKLIPLFINKGFNGTSMQDIVNTTSLNRSSIYNTFGDKQALYQKVLERYLQQQEELSRKVLKYDKNIKSALKLFFQDIFINKISDGCLVTNCSLELGTSNEELKCVLNKNREGMISFFEKLILLGQEKGDIKSSLIPKQTALFLFNNMQGLRVSESIIEKKDELDSIIDQLFDGL